MISLISLVVVLSLSLLITRVAAILLTYTGLSRDAANFQARSAFTGVGFTTTESESVVNHPVRRRIVRTLMLVGNAGVISAMASLILTFVGPDSDKVSSWIKLAVIMGSIALLWIMTSSRFLSRQLELLVHYFTRRFTSLKVRDYANLLHLSEEYEIAELAIHDHDWLAGKNLREADLRAEGINVLGVKKAGGEYIGAPDGETVIEANDVLLLYGVEEALDNLDLREMEGGDRKHQEAVARHRGQKI